MAGSRWRLVLTLAVLVLVLSAGAGWLLRGLLGRAPRQAQAGPELAARGLPLYQVHCAGCHGPDGHGDGPSAAELKPPPRDFAEGRWKFGTSATAVRRVIADGIAGTAMPASGQSLAPAELDALTAYVLTLAPGANGGRAAALEPLLQRAGLDPVASPAPTPALDLRSAAGESLSPDRLRGRVVLLVFWETTCAPCLGKLPQLARLAEEFRADGLTVLPVCLDDADASRAAEVAARHAPGLAVWADAAGAARLRYQVVAVPEVCLIDRDGRLLARGTGPSTWGGAEVRELVRVCLGLAGHGKT